MASGTGNLPHPGMVFTPFDILTAAEENQIVDNIEALADGSGIGDGAVTADKIDFTTLAFGNYSTSEVDTGFKWVNGKTIYKKTISFGALPNNTVKTVAHGISYEYIISVNSTAQANDGTLYPIPAVSTASVANLAAIGVNSTDILIRTNANLTTYTSTYVTLTYTKV